MTTPQWWRRTILKHPRCRRSTRCLPYGSADIGLPALPWPIQTTEQFNAALALVDARIAEQEAALAAVVALETVEPDAVEPADTGAPRDEAADEGERDVGATTEHGPKATAAAIGEQIEALRQLRVAIQRRATLHERLASIASKLAQAREQMERIERGGAATDPPFLISQIDQQQAEFSLKQAVEAMAKARLKRPQRDA
jgi:hypothetical protein